MQPITSQSPSVAPGGSHAAPPSSQLGAVVQLLDSVDTGDAEVFRDTFMRGWTEHQVCQTRQISSSEYGDRIKRVLRLIKRGPAPSGSMQPAFAGG